MSFNEAAILDQELLEDDLIEDEFVTKASFGDDVIDNENKK